MHATRPVLYSFRRCPYAIRARHAIAYSKIVVEKIEVSLKNKPSAMLQASSKATVPVLVLGNGRVIDESCDIMLWALAQHDPERWYCRLGKQQQEEINRLIDLCDKEFKPRLDRYKYSDRHLENSQEHYFLECTHFLRHLDHKIAVQGQLTGSNATLADIAILPFIRQFSKVNTHWFESCDVPSLKAWLNCYLQSDIFIEIMKK